MEKDELDGVYEVTEPSIHIIESEFGEQLQGMREFYRRAYGSKIDAYEEKIECLSLEIEELNQYTRHQKECEELLQNQLDNADEEIRKYQGDEEAIKQLDLSQIVELEKMVRVSLGRLESRKMELIESNLSIVNQQRLCTICMEEDRRVLLMPCRHLCVCSKCSEEASLQLCPICRNHVQDKVIVFI
eukprot:gene24976-30174_t